MTTGAEPAPPIKAALRLRAWLRRHLRPRARRLYMGLATLLGLGRLGFFIPCRYAGQAYTYARIPYGSLETPFVEARENFEAVLAAIEDQAPGLRAIEGGDGGGQYGSGMVPSFCQDWFPRLDGAAAYAMVRRHSPRRIIEIGSGYSTGFLARAVADGSLDCDITAIDPAPRADIADLGVEVIHAPVQKLGTGPFAALAAGDFLVVDSSHILMPGTDVDFILNGVLPLVPPGLFVHFHDIFLPDPYPEDWTWRGYNEQIAIAALFSGANAYELEFSSHYVTTRLCDRLMATVIADIAISPGAFETSLWLRKK
ncbi:MAG: class I SAM-dependent methyltransferase [Alphaproteobacteria bacterium]